MPGRYSDYTVMAVATDFHRGILPTSASAETLSLSLGKTAAVPEYPILPLWRANCAERGHH